MQTKFKIIAVASVLLILLNVINAFFVWGICFEEDGGFRFSNDPRFIEPHFPELHDSSIHIEDGSQSIGIPFILMCYPLDNPPYTISFILKDEKCTMNQMIIETVLIEYKSGDISQRNLDYVVDFRPSRSSSWENGKSVSTPIMLLEGKLPFLVERSESCTVKLKGYFLNRDQQKMMFESVNDFEYEPKNWRIYRGLGSI